MMVTYFACINYHMARPSLVWTFNSIVITAAVVTSQKKLSIYEGICIYYCDKSESI